MAGSIIRKKKLLLLSLMLLDKKMCNYVDRKRWTWEWLKRREEKGAYYSIFKELAVEDTPNSRICRIFLTLFPETAILKDCYLRLMG